jgi:hypothetical protein
MNCSFWPIATEGFAGLIESDCKVGDAGVTVTLVEPLTERKAALILAVPTFRADANPVEFKETTVGADEDQITSWLMSMVTPPGHVPIATNVC